MKMGTWWRDRCSFGIMGNKIGRCCKRSTAAPAANRRCWLRTMFTRFQISKAFLSSQIHGHRVALIAKTELADLRRNACGYTCFYGPLVQPALVKRVVVKRFLGGRTSHAVVKGELFYKAGIRFREWTGLPDEVEGRLRIEFGAL